MGLFKKAISTAETVNTVHGISQAESFYDWAADELKESVVKGVLKILWKLIKVSVVAIFKVIGFMFANAPDIETKDRRVRVLDSSSTYADSDGYVHLASHPHYKPPY